MTQPNETLHRPLFKGPGITDVTSTSDQFAGRTTLSSGSTSVTVSTRQVNSDAIIHATLLAAFAAGYTTQGRISIASGTSTGTASTTAVYSGDVISLEWESPNAITSGQALRVNSIVGGVSFAVATSNSLTTVASGAVAMWKLHGRDPAGIKVNTISHQNYFTLGWADGWPRAADVTVLWELRKTS